MKLFRTLGVLVCAFSLVTGLALAAGKTCCQTAQAEGKECKHKCCVAAHKEGKSCEKCNPNKEDLKKDAPKGDKKTTNS
ncbi:MAG TPA: hypothetical protein VNZ22_16125 [Bacillota bacterium]|nr:hypothetical protein [Bacillota bacterium]